MLKFYAGDSASDVKEENFVFTANQVSLNEAEADDTDEDDIDGVEYQFYEGKTVDAYIDGLQGDRYLYGGRGFYYLPEGDYMVQVVIDGYEYEPEDFELKSDDVDVCELITDDAEVTGYSNKGFLEILIDKNEDLVGMDEGDAEDEDYSYLDALFAGMRDNFIYVNSKPNEFVTADYRFARAASFGAMEAMVAIGLDNGCEIDFDDFEDLDSDFIDTEIEDNTITVELDDQLDDLDFLKVNYDEDDHVYEFDDNGKRDPILGVLTSFGLEEYYRYPYSYLMSAKELKADEKFAYTPKYYACDGYYTFCKFDEYLIRVGVAANAYTTGLVFDADYVPFEYKNSDAFKLLNKKNFYIAGEDYKFDFEAKDKTYDGKVEVASYYELDEPEFTMTDGKGSYVFAFDGSGGVQMGISKSNSSDESIFSFNVLDKEAYDEAVRVLGSIEGKGECALELDEQGAFVSTAAPVKITMACNEDSDRTVLNLYDDGTDKAVATVYNCLNSVQCDGRTNIVWNVTSNGQPIPNGKYYFKVSFEIDGKKVVPEASETFIVNNTGGNLPGPGGAFPDVPANHPYLNGINWMRTQGFIQGYPDGTFRPEVCVNRAELVKMVSGSVGVLSGSLGQTRSYVDVNPIDWFYRFVMDASSYGWVQGYPDGTFRPGNCVTRAEAIKVAMVANNLQTVLGQGSYFADVNPNDWFYGFVNTAYVKQIVGTSHVYNSQFRPNESMTRAEVAEMLYRISRSYGSQNYPAAGTPYGEQIYR